MDLSPGIAVEDDELSRFCREHGIKHLALFGSALRGELRPDSDIDLLVELEPDRVPGLIGIAQMELELEALVQRRVLRTLADLSSYFRDDVSATARTLYDAA